MKDKNTEQTIDWIELAQKACNHAGLEYGEIETITTWQQQYIHSENFRSSAVFRIGNQHCLKIYGRRAKRLFTTESAVLQTLNEADIPSPRFISAGMPEDIPPYLIMTEIDGDTLQHTWGSLSHSELLSIAREIGTLTAKLHRVPQDKLSAIEKQFGGRKESIQEEQTKRIAEIKAMEHLSSRHKEELIQFLLGEALEFLNVLPCLTHSDFSHAHIYLARENELWHVSAFIDWAEAILGPPEWDTAFHWFWTFSQDKETMHEYLKTYYADKSVPERFARRCFSTHLFTYSMGEVWDYFGEEVDENESIVQKMIEVLFPPDVFGSPD